MTIRPASPADRAFVLHLAARLASFPVPAWRTGPEVVDGDRRALAAWFDRADRRGETMLIAEIDRRPVGAAYLVTLTDYFLQRAHGHVSVLAVSADAEGRGIGSALLDAATDWARHPRRCAT
ncbi:MAG: GNAT family N-acetyltransferase [Acidobacteria bacterium]|nr:GNAT family N-acetyltransferase [Acidobacteriota bacterium]